MDSGKNGDVGSSGGCFIGLAMQKHEKDPTLAQKEMKRIRQRKKRNDEKETGWAGGDTNPTRVLVLDSSWAAGDTAQKTER